MAKKTNTTARAAKTAAKAPKVTAAPAAAEPKAKKVDYPLADGKKLDAVPKDWSPEKHKPLKRSMFSCPSVWMDWKADQLDQQAKDLRTEAKQIREMGGAKEVKAAKKIKQLMAKAEELKAQLPEGVDVDALLKALAGN